MANSKMQLKKKRQFRVRKKVVGTPERPRMAVFRSNKHISVQVIDDSTGNTLAACSTYEADFRQGAGTIDGAKSIGAKVGERAKAAGVTTVVFDRGGNRYQGRVAALADAAREAGLEF